MRERGPLPWGRQPDGAYVPGCTSAGACGRKEERG